MKSNPSWRFKSLIVAFVACMAFTTFAQQKLPLQREELFDVAVSTATGRFSAAASAWRIHRLTRKLPALKVGYGVRFTTFVGANKFYVTAPAKFTSPVQNLGTIFSETIEKNIDTITTATASTHSVNLAVCIEYSIAKKIDLGFTIDVVGFSFGPRKEFNVISSTFDPNQSPVATGSPTRLNLLLTSDNDIGSLNSEFYLRYWMKRKLGIRAGYTFLFSEYTLDTKLSFDAGRIMNDRYRYKASMAMLGVSYRPFD